MLGDESTLPIELYFAETPRLSDEDLETLFKIAQIDPQSYPTEPPVFSTASPLAQIFTQTPPTLLNASIFAATQHINHIALTTTSLAKLQYLGQFFLSLLQQNPRQATQHYSHDVFLRAALFNEELALTCFTLLLQQLPENDIIWVFLTFSIGIFKQKYFLDNSLILTPFKSYPTLEYLEKIFTLYVLCPSLQNAFQQRLRAMLSNECINHCERYLAYYRENKCLDNLMPYEMALAPLLGGQDAMTPQTELDNEYTSPSSVKKYSQFINKTVVDKLSTLDKNALIWLYFATALNIRPKTNLRVGRTIVTPPHPYYQITINPILDLLAARPEMRTYYVKGICSALEPEIGQLLYNTSVHILTFYLQRLNIASMRWLYLTLRNFSAWDQAYPLNKDPCHHLDEDNERIAKILYIINAKPSFIENTQQILLSIEPTLAKLRSDIEELISFPLFQGHAGNFLYFAASSYEHAAPILSYAISRLGSPYLEWFSDGLQSGRFDSQPLSRPMNEPSIEDWHIDLQYLTLSLALALRNRMLRQDAYAHLHFDAKTPTAPITVLHLDNMPFGDLGAVVIANSLKHLVHITHLSMTNIGMGNSGLIALTNHLQHMSALVSIAFHHNAFSASGVQHLTTWLDTQPPSDRKIIFQDALIQCLQNRRVIQIILARLSLLNDFSLPIQSLGETAFFTTDDDKTELGIANVIWRHGLNEPAFVTLLKTKLGANQSPADTIHQLVYAAIHTGNAQLIWGITEKILSQSSMKTVKSWAKKALETGQLVLTPKSIASFSKEQQLYTLYLFCFMLRSTRDYHFALAHKVGLDLTTRLPPLTKIDIEYSLSLVQQYFLAMALSHQADTVTEIRLANTTLGEEPLSNLLCGLILKRSLNIFSFKDSLLEEPNIDEMARFVRSHPTLHTLVLEGCIEDDTGEKIVTALHYSPLRVLSLQDSKSSPALLLNTINQIACLLQTKDSSLEHLTLSGYSIGLFTLVHLFKAISLQTSQNPLRALILNDNPLLERNAAGYLLDLADKIDTLEQTQINGLGWGGSLVNLATIKDAADALATLVTPSDIANGQPGGKPILRRCQSSPDLFDKTAQPLTTLANAFMKASSIEKLTADPISLPPSNRRIARTASDGVVKPP